METIDFNKKIYCIDNIKKTAEEFKNLSDISVKEIGGKIKVTFDKIDPEYKDVIKDEFANFVLGLMG
ncbi:HxsD-like protein [Candidatus Falkowbacteria bacterium]|nr:HxsD-like protein [Candidatus Falkowbacteria bacterium]